MQTHSTAHQMFARGRWQSPSGEWLNLHLVACPSHPLETSSGKMEFHACKTNGGASSGDETRDVSQGKKDWANCLLIIFGRCVLCFVRFCVWR
mmetsp:Transcript_32400/g.78423  ORF Transcript_32400/g.78423 Transcript_32400/m.78423 type:complete len:93 (+) Transcript_32400:1436-1714(+)